MMLIAWNWDQIYGVISRAMKWVHIIADLDDIVETFTLSLLILYDGTHT